MCVISTGKMPGRLNVPVLKIQDLDIKYFETKLPRLFFKYTNVIYILSMHFASLFAKDLEQKKRKRAEEYV